jgi:tetratricopeptide (TPR) repeat protein
MSQSQANWDEEIPYDPEAEYQALLRALRRKRGFGLFFVQCSPAEGEKIIQRVQTDLSQKRIEVLKLEESLEQGNLYERVETFLQARKNVEILFIQGLEYSLYDYEETKKRLGWSSEEIYSYSWKGVPRILSHLNQQRERFRDNFDCSFVFLVPLFVIKYFIQRAPDFFDWRSGMFWFPGDPQQVEQEARQVVLEGGYQKYLLLSPTKRWQKILQIRELLENPHQTTDGKAELLFVLCSLFYSEQDYGNTIASLDQVIEFKPDDHEAWFNKGNVLYDLGCKGDAIAAYEQAIHFKPDDHEAWYSKGVALSDLERDEEAIAAFDEAIRHKLDYHEAWYFKGITLYSLKRDKEALAALNKAVHYKPDYYLAWHLKGIALLNSGRHEEAIAAFDQAIYYKSNYYSAWYFKGIVLLNLGRNEDAIAAFDKAIHYKPDYYSAWHLKGIALSELGRNEEAVIAFDQSIHYQPDYHLTWHFKGNALLNLGRHEEAVAAYDAALHYKPDYYPAWCLKGDTLLNLGRSEEATIAFDQAIHYECENPIAWYLKACCFALQGNLIEAIEALSRAIELDPKYRKLAKTDADFDRIRDEDWFQAMIEESSQD